MSQQEVFGLMAAAEEQQKAAQAAVAGLTKERQALATAIQSLQTVQAGLGAAIGAAVRQSLTGASAAAEAAMRAAVAPATDGLASAGIQAVQAAQVMQQASRKLAWSWAIAAGVAAGVFAVLAGGVGYAVGRYEAGATADLRAERDALQAAVDDLAKRGGRIKLQTCGQQGAGRLCVQIDQAAGTYGNERAGWFAVPKGY